MSLIDIHDDPPRLPKGTTGNDLTLDDDLDIGGDITNVETIQFDLENVTPPAEGKMGWDIENQTVSIGMPGGQVNGQLLQEAFLPRSKANDDLVNGTLVRIVGGVGSNPIVDVADPDSIETVGAIGMTTEDIDNNQFGYVTTRGLVRGAEAQPIDTSSHIPGTILFMDDDGGWTNIRPDAPRFSVFIGTVIRQHASLGEIYVTIVAIPRLRGLSDVYSPTVPNDGDVIKWDAANARWKVGAP